MKLPAVIDIDVEAVEVESESPDVRDAARVMFSAFVYWTVVKVVELDAAPIVPVIFVSVPWEPPPSCVEIASEIPVALVTFEALPFASWD